MMLIFESDYYSKVLLLNTRYALVKKKFRSSEKVTQSTKLKFGEMILANNL